MQKGKIIPMWGLNKYSTKGLLSSLQDFVEKYSAKGLLSSLQMKSLVILVAMISWVGVMEAQDEGTFTMEVSSDTVLMGNQIILKYTIENLEGEYSAPDLSHFRIVSGPNVSSQFSSINGKVNQKSTYSYSLLPLEEGVAQIGSARITSADSEIILDSVDVVVLPNSDGIIDRYGVPLKYRNKIGSLDTLSEEQKILERKLKKGKKHKI